MAAQPVRPRISVQEAQRIRVNLLRLAGLAAVLGLLIEALLVIGGEPPSFLGLIDNGLWPFMVCAAVGIGQALVGGWPAKAGAFSLVATPIAFVLAKVIQKGMVVLTGGTNSGTLVGGDLLLEAGLRALEYAVLAATLAWLVRQPWAGALAHIGLGVMIGLVFGALIALFLPPPGAIGFFAEEILFPAGCTLIVFVSETVMSVLGSVGGA